MQPKNDRVKFYIPFNRKGHFANSNWGANADTLLSSTLALCFSVAEGTVGQCGQARGIQTS